jgi:hypothetical protein
MKPSQIWSAARSSGSEDDDAIANSADYCIVQWARVLPVAA